MKISRKILAIVCIIMLTATMVSATLMTVYGSIHSTINVQPSILIDGEPWTEPITHELNGYGGDTFQFTHTITNVNSKELLFEWEHIGTPDLEGIDIELTVDGEPLGLQFSLESGESIDITFNFALYQMIKYGEYTIESNLIPGYC